MISTQSDQQLYKKAKFQFKNIEKCVSMDVFVKAVPDDLKFSFSNILSIDFFGKKLEFYFLQGPDDWQLIDSTISFDENECVMRYLVKNTNAELSFRIEFKDIGA